MGKSLDLFEKEDRDFLYSENGTAGCATGAFFARLLSMLEGRRKKAVQALLFLVK